MFDSNLVDREFILRIFAFLCISCLIILGSADAFASSGAATADPIGDALCNITKKLNGGIAKGIATIAIFAMGFGFFTGKLQWTMALTIAVAIVIVFKAGDIVVFISGDSATKCT
jgi:type IV secretory pathway VirB2 component (pilin)